MQGSSAVKTKHNYDKDFIVDKMRYQKNSFSYAFILFGLLLSIITLFMIINPAKFNEGFVNEAGNITYDYTYYILVAIEVIIGIITMLMSFLCAEKVKSYDKFWSETGVYILVVINLARIAIVPLYVLVNLDKLCRVTRTGSIQAFSLMDYLAPIFLLVIGAGCYIVVGVIGTIKSKKLRNHLERLNNNV